MPLDDEVLQEIAGEVRGGFWDRSRLIDIFCEEMYAPGDLDPDEVTAEVDLALARHEADKATWPAVTDVDRLDQAFASLFAQGVIALQNAGFTSSDGYSDFRHTLSIHPDPASIRGYCFYHGQDLERAVRGKGLYLSFGPTDPNLEETEGPVIGRLIVQTLEQHGLKVAWKGTFQDKLLIPAIDWKKR